MSRLSGCDVYLIILISRVVGLLVSELLTWGTSPGQYL